jgi:hypothetical protein
MLQGTLKGNDTARYDVLVGSGLGMRVCISFFLVLVVILSLAHALT